MQGAQSNGHSGDVWLKRCGAPGGVASLALSRGGKTRPGMSRTKSIAPRTRLNSMALSLISEALLSMEPNTPGCSDAAVSGRAVGAAVACGDTFGISAGGTGFDATRPG